MGAHSRQEDAVAGPTSGSAALSLRAVTVRRGPRTVLDGVDLDVPAGVLLRVHGRNGSGKSTLLRVVAGVVPPTHGTVARTAVRVAYVPERDDLGGALTVRAHLRHLARITPAGSPAPGRRRADAAVDTLLERYGLSAHADAPVRTLSKGTRRKVAVAQALLEPAGLLVVDEPTDGLDRAAVERLRTDVAAAVRGGTAVVAACHTDDLDDLGVPTVHVSVVDGRVHPHGVAPVAGDAGVLVEILEHGVLRRRVVAPGDLARVLLEALRSGAVVHRVDPDAPAHLEGTAPGVARVAR